MGPCNMVPPVEEAANSVAVANEPLTSEVCDRPGDSRGPSFSIFDELSYFYLSL